MSDSEVSIVTYNVLSPHLSSPEVFHACRPADLDPVARLEKLKEVVRFCTERSYIICLQEVCLSWSSELRQLFEEENYHYIDAISGSAENECFGQATAYPRDRYALMRSKTLVLGSTIKSRGGSSRPSGFMEWAGSFGGGALLDCTAVLLIALGSLMHWMVRSGWAAHLNMPFADHSDALATIVMYLLCLRMAHHIASLIKDRRPQHPQLSPVQVASRKNRRVLSLCLRKLNDSISVANLRKFTVTNYHMPCSFKEPVVMYLHMEALLVHFHDFRRDLPGVLAGDMNIRPSSWLYQYMTHGFEEGRPKSDPLVYWDQMEQALACCRDELPPMRTTKPVTSAYAAVNGKEPQFTCRAVTSFAGEFRDTLDYIMMSSGFNAWLCTTVCEGADDGPSLPNAQQCSDHLPLMAVLKLTGERSTHE